MKKHNNKLQLFGLLIVLLGFASPISSQNSLYKLDWIPWQSPDIQVLDLTNSTATAQQFCDQLTKAQTKIGRLNCRVPGEWLRDSASSVYVKWLQQNWHILSSRRDLMPRDTGVIQRFRNLDDQYLIVFGNKNDTLWALFFAGPASLEPQLAPEAPVASIYWTQKLDISQTAPDIAKYWFSKSPYARISAEKRASLAAMPHGSFAPPPPMDYWVGIDIGQTQATLPFFPESWWAKSQNDALKNYRYSNDTITAWSILKDKSPLLAIRSGFTWAGFVGLELMLLRSTHSVKYSAENPEYADLDHWSFTRYELGATAHWIYRKPFHPQWEWQGTVYAGFHYSFLQEDIAPKTDIILNDNYNNRIAFEPFYKGAIAGLGSRLVYNKLIGLYFRTGLNNRSKNLDEASNQSAIIARSTLDYFATLGLEFHWQGRVVE